MAALTDEERAKAILGDVEDKSPAETPENTDAAAEEEQETPEAAEAEDTESEEEKPAEDTEETEEATDSSFTKQFPNLKGETLAEYVPELEKAYDNSFKEALRLNDVIKEKDKVIQDNTAVIEQARQIVAQAQQTTAQAATGQTPAPPAPVAPTTQESPEIEWIRNERRRVMMSAFDTFKTEYPQVLDATEFERFRKATDGVKVALTASTGQEPTDLDIFKATAGSFGWQPAAKQARKDAAIKENGSSGRTPSSQSPAASRPAKVSEAQVDAYLKMFTSKTREDAVKELSEVV